MNAAWFLKYPLPQARAMVVGLLVLLGLYCLWAASWIHLKAWLAQQLIDRAWAQTLHQPSSGALTPWPWADTQPVAKLRLPSGEELIVLAGAQGNSLAFGPGLVEGSDLPGAGFAVIGGHRDTHFAPLAHALPGQTLAVSTRTATTLFTVRFAGVVDIHETPLVKENSNALVLVTCYPFTGLQSDPTKRWVVHAVAKHAVAKEVKEGAIEELEKPAEQRASFRANARGRPGGTTSFRF
ncbi:class GN sortase [Simiduia sp. 21SJ11W-1]|uniref:class GN sortase n=1 Tax=Simiduia sp. 21SJ11W-1 TaxID=2909669 RepID=UPI0020A230E8|nr:class GN sortase [Simiduia sp. 21SJ11W-1]UTA49086.1 class GN sortase [Simiduia sp. 21SJ11W-1]